ncbi:MAG: elongation factor P, partial [Candidatus Pacebacteria bacterium]|nr:elongation factor P [Candidatus Paceibacterota bacterium]
MSDKVDEADISRRNIVYIYSQGEQHWFHSEGDKSDRFTLNSVIIGNILNYVSGNDTVDALVYTDDEDEEKIIGFKLPIKMELTVTEAPPSIKGNTATGGDKVVTVHTGLKVTAPLFINIGDVIAVNTERGEYTERVSKA